MGQTSRRGGPIFADFKTATLRGTPGYFRLGRTQNDAWWLLTPEDEPCLLRAVAGVNRHGRAGPPPVRRSAYAQTVENLYGTTGAAWEKSTVARLHAWGVDTVGPWADPGLMHRGFYFTALANFCRADTPLLHGPGLRLPDVFDPRWPLAAEAHAAAVAAPWLGRRELVGWFTDDALGWGDSPGGISLLQSCLSLEPAYSAHHAAWEFVLAANGGTHDALGRAWGLSLAHRENVRQLTRLERPLSGTAFAEDAQRFAQEVARRYFATTGRALREADPSHLVLGCRFATPPPPGVREACVWPDMDAVSWRHHARDTFSIQASEAGHDMPQWVTGGGLNHGDFCRLPVRDGTGPTRLERLLRSGREALIAACRDPRTVGVEWAHWADGSDDTPPFGAGLVHADDHEAVEHTELLTHVLARARSLHAQGPAKTHSSTPSIK
ncbi:MAG: hypothetical protein RL376_1862 [Verrucomicrobiota bacterium]